jgi:DNA-directed RNA polymerase beta' subunit
MKAQKLIKGKVQLCHHCSEAHPKIKKSTRPTLSKEPYAIEAQYMTGDVVTKTDMLYPHVIFNILNKVTDETMWSLGKAIHPRNCILHDIIIPSVTIRPDAKKTGGKNTNDPLTIILQAIIKNFAPVNIEDINDKVEKKIFDMSNLYTDFVKTRGDGVSDSLVTKISGKQGLGRKHLLSKRVWKICRSTIINDPTLKIDEVGVPLAFAKEIKIEDTVQEYNKQFLVSLLINGADTYPGANALRKRSTGVIYSGQRAIEHVEVGDTVFRDVMDGDYCNFNRQPSLTPSQIATHRVVINYNPNDKAITMNVLVCPLYKADFDGDAMHLIFASGASSRNEISCLSGVSTFLLNHIDGVVEIGAAEDAVIGSAELTRQNTRLDKFHIMKLFGNIDDIVRVYEPELTGRECFSLLMDDMPINYSGMARYYNQPYESWMKYEMTDTHVVIDQGTLKSGYIDKSTIGSGIGLIHSMARTYGNEKTLKFVFNIQQMAIGYSLQSGFTMGIMDFVIPPDVKQRIMQISSDIINKSTLITQRLNSMDIIPPIGKTIEEYYEEQQMATLKEYESFYEPIISSIDVNKNNLFKLINHGSKGVMAQMVNLVSNVGQKIINGERIQTKFSKARSLVYYKRFDSNPQARGYIANSYIDGMTSGEFIFAAMYCRFDLISNALLTSVTGMQHRISVKNLESIIVNNMRRSQKHNNIVQLVYGGDAVDVRYNQKVKIPTVFMGDDELKTTYFHASFKEYYDHIVADRERYRRVYLKLENANELELITAERKIGVNVDSIIVDALKDNEEDLIAPDAKSLATMVDMVESLIRNLPYALTNEIQERRQFPHPEYLEAATWLLQVVCRCLLHPNALVKRQFSIPILRLIIDKIRYKYRQSLISPGTAAGIISAQCFSGPLTQYMLDSKHRSHLGGTSKSVMTDVKEVIGAKPVAKLANPIMIISVDKSIRENEDAVKKIAASLEVMALKDFATHMQLFYEKYGLPVHPSYSNETAMFTEFNKLNPLLKPPSNLINWCVRITINRMMLILKNMPFEVIIEKLRQQKYYVVYTPENSPNIIIRVYFPNDLFKGEVSIPKMIEALQSIRDMSIRGVPGIRSTRVAPLIRHTVQPDGSLKRSNWYCIKTIGTNVEAMLTYPGIDPTGVLTNAILEIQQMFGIEAAWQAIIGAMKKLGTLINYRHYMMYADEMTFTGKVTSIETVGIRAREPNNILLRAGVGSTRTVLEEAASNTINCELQGISGYLMVGAMPKLGTSFNQYYVNEEFVRKNMKSADEMIEALL